MKRFRIPNATHPNRSEWFFPKVWQILDEAPEIYAAADASSKRADWLSGSSGEETRNIPRRIHGHLVQRKASRKEFFKALDPVENVVKENEPKDRPIGTKAGELTAQRSMDRLKPHRRRSSDVDGTCRFLASTVVEAAVVLSGHLQCHMS